MKTAIVIGATGLVGRALVRLLIDDPRFERVRVFARRGTGVAAPKLEEHLVDFERLADFGDLIRGDVLFSSLGTTRSQAGSKEAQYRVDHTYQLEFARLAAANGVPSYVLVSSAGASAKAMSFYMRMKGELERDVAALPFKHIHILQPGFLAGRRDPPRAGEKIGLAVMNAFGAIGPLRPYRPIEDSTVGRAMIACAFDESAKLAVHQPGSLFSLGGV